jgi:hypothetical protein
MMIMIIVIGVLSSHSLMFGPKNRGKCTTGEEASFAGPPVEKEWAPHVD